jgi:hypothetical protein
MNEGLSEIAQYVEYPQPPRGEVRWISHFGARGDYARIPVPSMTSVGSARGRKLDNGHGTPEGIAAHPCASAYR